MDKIIGITMSIRNGQGKATPHQIMSLGFGTVEEMPLAGRRVVFVGIVSKYGGGIIIWVYADGINLDSVFVSERILYPFHFIGHDRTNTRAAGKNEVYNGKFTIHLFPTHDSTVLGYKRKVRDIMLLSFCIITGPKWIFYALFEQNGYLVVVFPKTPQKNDDDHRY